jgi:hypothetical protein
MLNKERKLIGACGLNCAACNIYQAYTRKDVEAQRKIAKSLFGENTTIGAEKITCDGCGGRLDIHWSSDCKIMQCVQERKLVACSQCSEFPCPNLEAFYARSYEKAEQNALKQREIGLEAWWQSQQR